MCSFVSVPVQDGAWMYFEMDHMPGCRSSTRKSMPHFAVEVYLTWRTNLCEGYKYIHVYTCNTSSNTVVYVLLELGHFSLLGTRITEPLTAFIVEAKWEYEGGKRKDLEGDTNVERWGTYEGIWLSLHRLPWLGVGRMNRQEATACNVERKSVWNCAMCMSFTNRSTLGFHSYSIGLCQYAIE